jgi:hypothetical protein
MFDQERITCIVKAAGQGPRDAQALIDLAQQQHAPIAAKIACRKVGDDPARTDQELGRSWSYGQAKGL